MHPNPVSAIIAFKDAIDFELKEYNAMIEDVQLNELPKNSVANKSNNFNCPNGCGINGDLGTCSICIGK